MLYRLFSTISCGIDITLMNTVIDIIFEEFQNETQDMELSLHDKYHELILIPVLQGIDGLNCEKGWYRFTS